ncbi:hypothetical protein [Micromonospora coxensis]|uniref:Uncharacterized protein n=1 Tax=Micromonospora coxensis TaxID=356852 RepID=A0A1C5H1I7_9ACTN|nr:hypothetical protein [Micromonospora coxensis]SCG39915.1 hypothetical protein GA0070614_0687 [Micromonospora coxensis]
MKTHVPVPVTVLGASLALLIVVGCVAAAIRYVGDDTDETSACRESVQAGEAKVRTERWDPPEELPGVGDYPEIRWQVRAMGDPCTRAPGPTEWAYQGVVTLRPQDARRLAQRYGFAAHLPPSPGPADAWPALVPFLPAQPRWLHSTVYDEASPSTRWRVAFLDVERRTLFFVLRDH